MDMSKLAGAALALPGCLMAAASVVALTLALFGRHPMWPHEPLNLAEAAGVRGEAEVVRLIELGQDPNVRHVVRPGLRFGHPTSLTPLEAAVANDDPEVVRRLLAMGAMMDSAQWTYLRCIAEGEHVRLALDEIGPADATPRCDGVTPPWDVDAGG
jgi:hypothetical protein